MQYSGWRIDRIKLVTLSSYAIATAGIPLRIAKIKECKRIPSTRSQFCKTLTFSSRDNVKSTQIALWGFFILFNNLVWYSIILLRLFCCAMKGDKDRGRGRIPQIDLRHGRYWDSHSCGSFICAAHLRKVTPTRGRLLAFPWKFSLINWQSCIKVRIFHAGSRVCRYLNPIRIYSERNHEVF